MGAQKLSPTVAYLKRGISAAYAKGEFPLVRRVFMSGRSLQVTRTYLQKGRSVSRSLWVRVSPQHPLLKALTVPPIAMLMLVTLIMFLMILGFTLLAVALMQAMARTERKAARKVEASDGYSRGHLYQEQTSVPD